jgi:hypothetical protein
MVRALLIGSFLFAVSCFAQGHSGGSRGGGGGHYSSGGHSYGRGGYVYAYPVYVGGYGGYYGGYSSGYYGDYGSGYAPAYGYVDPSLQGQAPAPPVVINQYFGAPPVGASGPPDQQDDQNIRMYQQQPPPTGYTPAPASDSRSYLIAYKDHSVYTAVAYWIEGNTLHYITSGNTHNQADLDLIDIEFTKKLNNDRSMPFNVPASQ